MANGIDALPAARTHCSNSLFSRLGPFVRILVGTAAYPSR